MKLTVIGTGYVGLVSGTCFAEMGNDVICVDNNKDKIDGLNSGKIPIWEPGLEEMVHRNAEGGRLTFTTNIKDAVENSDICFIAVGTPPDEDGSADLQYVLAVARDIAKYMNGLNLNVTPPTFKALSFSMASNLACGDGTPISILLAISAFILMILTLTFQHFLFLNNFYMHSLTAH